MWKRNCPKCNREIFYKNKRSLDNSIHRNKLCRECGQCKNGRKIDAVIRNCPTCNKEIHYKSKMSCYNANRNKSNCLSCSASLQMKNEITRQRRIASLKLVKRPWNAEIAKRRKENGGYVCSEETKEKHRINKINKMLDDGTLIWPNYSYSACKIFDRLENDLNLNGFYATKNKERRIGRFWVDYYEPDKNIIIEFDEKYHFDSNGKLKEKDICRQKWIENKIGCKFYRINENTDYDSFKNILLIEIEKMK